MGDERIKEPEKLTDVENGDDDSHARAKIGDAQHAPSTTPAVEDAVLKSPKPSKAETDKQAPPASDDRYDSEAETVVLQGKGRDESTGEVQKIKLEDEDSEYEDSQSNASNRIRSGAERRSRDAGHRQHLKRKRGDTEPKYEEGVNGQDSSNLSSNASSPAPHAHSSKTSESRSLSSSPDGDDGAAGKSRKKLTRHDGRKHQRGRSNTGASVDSIGANVRAALRKTVSKDRHSQHSQSPQPVKSRVRSTQSHGASHKVNKRRKPTPLNVEQHRKQSEDAQAESDDSSSAHSHHRSRKIGSLDAHAMSPAKTSHKKNRDRSGQTALARSCRKDVKVEEVERLLRDHPEDINVPDYAGNTPLQFASLAGNDAVVKLLLDNKCDTTCVNLERDTPLIDAIENSNLGVVRLLLEAGVNPRIRNGRGVEPIDLVDLDDDSGEAIKQALLQARKEKDNDLIRRQSEDHRLGAGRDTDTASAQASGASPTESTRSPPPLPVDSSRKRTARSQQSDDALLWVNPTPERLRTEAGRGNLKFVAHILGMKQTAETEAVLAAVKGGHDEVLGVILGMAETEADPEPLQKPGEKPGQNTPMLAAIGRGNLDVVKLLLDQAGFDPTRRMFKNMTYSEISRERQGEFWEEETDILQKAFEEHQRTGGHRSNTSSPRKVRKQRIHTQKELIEPSSPPQVHQKIRKPHNIVKQDIDAEPKRMPSYQGTAAKQRGPEKDPSDKSQGRFSQSAAKPGDRPKSAGNDDSFRPPSVDPSKPKRKLMSGNDLKSTTDIKKRARTFDDDRTESNHSSAKLKNRQSVSSGTTHRDGEGERHLSVNKPKKASSEEPTHSKDGASRKKRARASASPKASKTELTDVAKKIKRPRVGSLGDSKDNVQQDPAGTKVAAASPPPSAAKVVSPSQGAAPVAFMGGASSIPVMLSPTQEKDLHVPSTDIIQTSLDSAGDPSASGGNQHDTSAVLQNGDLQMKEEEERRLKAELEKEEKAKREEEAARKREEEERQKRLKQEAEERRRALEAERLAQLEREAEEARLAKIKREEELQRRRMEEERLKREEQERKRKEREEREALRRRQQLEEEKRARMEALPNGLRRAAELAGEAARQPKEIIKWLPLRTASTSDLYPDFAREGSDEPWISNVQAAPILANQDLELSQCKYPFPFIRNLSI